jgi:uncharacterized protein (TIGR00251 family)
MLRLVEATSPIRAHADGAVLDVWVVPGASRTEITGIHNASLRIRIAAPPSGGAANQALVRYLSRRLKCRVELIAGAGARRKQLRIDCADLAWIAATLGVGSA